MSTAPVNARLSIDGGVPFVDRAENELADQLVNEVLDAAEERLYSRGSRGCSSVG
jgi:hypothetical protein